MKNNKPKQRQASEGYQPKAPEGYMGPGKPPTGGSGTKPARSGASPVDFFGKTIRLYEACYRCDGTGRNPENRDCVNCNGGGTVAIHVTLEELRQALQMIALGASERACEALDRTDDEQVIPSKTGE